MVDSIRNYSHCYDQPDYAVPSLVSAGNVEVP